MAKKKSRAKNRRAPDKKIIISVIQQKGGVGKTTLTVHLAHMLAALRPKWRVAVADADPQQSASQWISRGTSLGVSGVQGVQVATDGEGKLLRKELTSIDADIVVIDLPPAIESISLRAALYADIMLIPVGASTLDIEAAEAAVNVCMEAIELDARKKMILVPSRIRSATASAKELRPILEKWGTVSKTSLSLRVAFSDAATSGEGIHSFAPSSPADQEMFQLTQEVLKYIES